MVMKKLLFGLVAVMFLVTPAMAGNQPEFDAVGCDATNFFNDFIKVAVCDMGTLDVGPPRGLIKINEWSAFDNEFFQTTAGMILPDSCFNTVCPSEGYTSALIDPWNEAIYTWQIVLQKKPESDIDLNIRDCVTKHNTFNIWTEAEQTGRYRAPWGQLFFVPTANPSVTVAASPGPFATPGFVGPFLMDARTMPGILTLVALNDVLYTSKALWEESLVMALPATGGTNQIGQPQYNLHQGDVITVIVRIPPNNTVDLRYGADNVTLKYIGIVGMEYVNIADVVIDPVTGETEPATACGQCEGCI